MIFKLCMPLVHCNHKTLSKFLEKELHKPCSVLASIDINVTSFTFKSAKDTRFLRPVVLLYFATYPEAVGNTAGVPFLESGDIDLGQDKILHLTKLIPDEANLGDVNIKLKSKLYPTSSETTHPSSGSYSSTNPTPIRVSGKQLKVRFEANTSQPSDFRIGTFKMEGKAGGGR